MGIKEKPQSILIIANGRLPQKYYVKRLVSGARYIIAVDGGSNFCYEENIYPHFIIGDLDSIDNKVLKHFHDAEIIQIKDQNRHDLDKALEFAQSLSPDKIAVVGVFGKRLDHSIANLLLLQSLKSNCSITFFDDYGRLSLLSENLKIDCYKNQTVSLFSFLPIQGLTLEGFKYSLQNQDFPNGFSGLSNIAITDQPKIMIKSGSLFLYIIHEDITT